MFLSSATSSEREVLALQFDGPIPTTALADLRACPLRPFAATDLSDAALARWLALIWRNLKLAQRCLLAVRRQDQRRVRWALQQCLSARRDWRVLAAETARRASVFTAQVRTLNALNEVLGV